MVVSEERCNICGVVSEFTIGDEAVLLREARCGHCGASLRNSDVADVLISYIDGDNEVGLGAERRLCSYRILNTCSSGYIHNALKNYPNYTCCEYFNGVESGEYHRGTLCVDLCNIPFEDAMFDLIVSEDVLEHIADYGKAFKEIRRV